MTLIDDNPVRFALLGCGSVAKKHLTALARIPEAKVVAVCDLSLDRARSMGEQYNLPYYDNPHKLLAEMPVDAISVLTPSGQHFFNVMDLVKYGKAFVVEKPLALRLDHADEMIAAADHYGSRLFVVQQNRCNKPVTMLKQALDQGRFGRLVMGTVRVRWCRTQEYYDACDWRGTWAEDGGVLTNQASHHIDLLTWLMGPVDSVMAMSATRLVKIEVEDTAAAIIRFHNGALGIIEATTATRPKDLEGSLSIMGEKGSVVIGGFYANQLQTWQFAEMTPEDQQLAESGCSNPNQPAWNHGEYLQSIIRSLRERTRGLVEGLEARKSLELINAIYESAESGEEVALSFRPRKCRLGIKHDGC